MRSSNLNRFKFGFDLDRKSVFCAEIEEVHWWKRGTSVRSNIRNSGSMRSRWSRWSRRSNHRCLRMGEELSKAREIDSYRLRKILPRGCKTALSKEAYIVSVLRVCGIEDFGIWRRFAIDTFNFSFLGTKSVSSRNIEKKNLEMILQLRQPMYANACE